MWPHLNADERLECIQNEESTVYSQAIHYANRMVYLRVPLDVSKGIRSPTSFEESTSNSNFTNRLVVNIIEYKIEYDEVIIGYKLHVLSGAYGCQKWCGALAFPNI